MLATAIGDLRKRTAMFRLGRLPERVDQVCDEHLAIVEALASGDGEAARAAMQTHIDNVRAHLLQRLTAIHAHAFGGGGRVATGLRALCSTSGDACLHGTEARGMAEPEIRKIIHVDMDAFYASVEQRDDP